VITTSIVRVSVSFIFICCSKLVLQMCVSVSVIQGLEIVSRIKNSEEKSEVTLFALSGTNRHCPLRRCCSVVVESSVRKEQLDWYFELLYKYVTFLYMTINQLRLNCKFGFRFNGDQSCSLYQIKLIT